MKRIILISASVLALVFATSAAAALVPGVFDPGNTGCPVATYNNGVLHLAKNCPTPTNAAAGADITGFAGATFTTGSFTLASAGQCNGGSPRFDVYTTTQSPFFLGCNNVTPVLNANGSATYTFNAATIAASGQVPFPTGTIQSIDVLVDVQGSADLTTHHGQRRDAGACRVAGWPADLEGPVQERRLKTFNNPTFKNQGECVMAWRRLRFARPSTTTTTITTGTTATTATRPLEIRAESSRERPQGVPDSSKPGTGPAALPGPRSWFILGAWPGARSSIRSRPGTGMHATGGSGRWSRTRTVPSSGPTLRCCARPATTSRRARARPGRAGCLPADRDRALRARRGCGHRRLDLLDASRRQAARRPRLQGRDTGRVRGAAAGLRAVRAPRRERATVRRR